MYVQKPVTSIKECLSEKIDNFYIKVLCPDKHPLSWFLKDMMRATPDRKKWSSFLIKSNFKRLIHDRSYIANLTADYNAAFLHNYHYLKSLKINYPEPFLEMSNQIIQVAYMAAYFYPTNKNESIILNQSIDLIQSYKGTLNHTYNFQRNHQYKTNEIRQTTQILKRKGHEDIFICSFDIESIEKRESTSVFVGYDSENFYYENHQSESASAFSNSPMDIDEVMKTFKVVSRNDLFKNLTLDLIAFMTGVTLADIPTHRDKILLDMNEI